MTQSKEKVKCFAFLTERKKYKQKKPASVKFKAFSKKQKQVLTWWREGSPIKGMGSIICDDSVHVGNYCNIPFLCHVGNGDVQGRELRHGRKNDWFI